MGKRLDEWLDEEVSQTIIQLKQLNSGGQLPSQIGIVSSIDRGYVDYFKRELEKKLSFNCLSVEVVLEPPKEGNYKIMLNYPF